MAPRFNNIKWHLLSWLALRPWNRKPEQLIGRTFCHAPLETANSGRDYNYQPDSDQDQARGRAFNATLIFTLAPAPDRTYPPHEWAVWHGLGRGRRRTDLITHVWLFKLGLPRTGNVSFMLIKYCLCQLGEAGSKAGEMGKELDIP